MFVKLSVLIIFLFFSFVAANAQKAVKGGIINGMATYLPEPEYPQDAKDFCAGGKIEVEVWIGEKGEVIEAKIISGDELLRKVSIEAARKARFRPPGYSLPVKIRGIVVYNFPLQEKCLIRGIVNEKALSIPKPIILQKIKVTGKVEVAIIIDSLTGKVISVRAISGHPLLRAACVSSARNAKFSPAGSLPQIRIRGTLVYTFKPDGTIEY